MTVTFKAKVRFEHFSYYRLSGPSFHKQSNKLMSCCQARGIAHEAMGSAWHRGQRGAAPPGFLRARHEARSTIGGILN